ncbi:xanthine dehydrogenase family protein molybdopterin-binding subunit [Pseudovibrio sp. Alg231-02]|uniref:xanthine dehydrogenase family protein molybdopterin-binding subunit n=1 Tax=Pseudovibrio sp. Alg231-02 TaxID=1922223 RepID=UPI000D562EF6|nr:molybdopterin cofactor-binding domain-containing protein [Pseudovibrio sp. Alg231-02]
MVSEISRRSFLKVGAAASSLVLGLGADVLSAKEHSDAEFTPFVRISVDGTVTVIVRHFECGQGTATGLSTLVAEELNFPLAEIRMEFAPAAADVYGRNGFMATGGSGSMRDAYIHYRSAGAAAREMLISAAARSWQVSPENVNLNNGVLSSIGKSAPMGRFVVEATQFPVPAKPQLKSSEAFTQIGNPEIGRIDNKEKVTGAAKYAMDMHLDDQVTAVILRSPRFGGKLTSFDVANVVDNPDFLRAHALPNGDGVAVFAKSTWAAFQARDLIIAEWDFSKAENRSSDEMRADLLSAVNSDPEYHAKGSIAGTASALENATQIIEQEFYFPHLAHAPMEPLTCTLARTETGVILYDGCQTPSGAQAVLSRMLQLEPKQIKIETLFAGGSFGRRANTGADYHREVAMAFLLFGGETPVKLVWSREDDIKGGYYRPAVAHKVRMGLDGTGRIVGWDHRVSGRAIFKGSFLERRMVRDGIDLGSVEGITDTPYSIPGHYVGVTDERSPITVNWWRSVGHSHTAYVMESMMDMAAAAAGQDPVSYRLSYLMGDSPDQKRLASVLRLVAQKSDWDGQVPEGRSRGVAIHKSFHTYVAEVVEISGNANDGVKIERITCAVDCGVPVNPNVIEAQMEGGIGFGIGHIMRDEITFTNGEVDQFNFPDYEPLRINDIGAIDTFIVPSVEPPTGVGEPGTPPAGPALANAIAATGVRVSHLPMSTNGVEFV